MKEYLKRYRVKIRRNWEVKPEAEQIDGKEYNFFGGWKIKELDHSLYVGEIAMIPRDENYPLSAPAWVASGDLEKM